MDKMQLTSVFSEREETLREELSKFYLPKDYQYIQQTINNHIIKLFSEDNDFKNSLNTSDAEMLNSALRMALSFQKLTLSNTIDFRKLSQKTEVEVERNVNQDKNDILEDTVSLLPTVICAFINPWLALAVGGSTVFVKKFIIGKNGKKRAVYVKERKVDISHLINKSEMDTIISGIYNICSEIDEIISKIQRDRKDLTSQMHDKINECTIEKMYPQILSSIQYLAKENMISVDKNPYIQNITFALQGYGYEIVDYKPSTIGFFSKKGNPNIDEETMYLPAIIKDVNGTKVVVAEGIVYTPIKINE